MVAQLRADSPLNPLPAHCPQVATYANAIDAAFRGYGFTVADNMPFFYTKLVEALDNLDTAHQGLYLGFRPSKPPADARLTALWSNLIPVIEYQVSKGRWGSMPVAQQLVP